MKAAFTSGMLSPDPEPMVLWSMEPAIDYRANDIYRRVTEFAGGSLPSSRVDPGCIAIEPAAIGALYTDFVSLQLAKEPSLQ